MVYYRVVKFEYARKASENIRNMKLSKEKIIGPNAKVFLVTVVCILVNYAGKLLAANAELPLLNILVWRSRLSGVARATCPNR